MKVVGKPYEGEPHVRFDVAGSGNQDHCPRRHSLTLPAVEAACHVSGGARYAPTVFAAEANVILREDINEEIGST